jgi:hypothetical protein
MVVSPSFLPHPKSHVSQIVKADMPMSYDVITMMEPVTML